MAPFFMFKSRFWYKQVVLFAFIYSHNDHMSTNFEIRLPNAGVVWAIAAMSVIAMAVFAACVPFLMVILFPTVPLLL